MVSPSETLNCQSDVGNEFVNSLVMLQAVAQGIAPHTECGKITVDKVRTRNPHTHGLEREGVAHDHPVFIRRISKVPRIR